MACASASPPPKQEASSAQARPVVASSADDPDRDHDGIPNECDVCPDAPENFNGLCDEDGCPDVPIDAFAHGTIEIAAVVLFDKQSSKISDIARPLLEQAAHALVTNADAIERVAVIGHASRDESNGDAISTSRAQAIVDAIVAMGVASGRVEAHGVGARKPFDEKDDALNRRVQFVILRAMGREQYRLNGDAVEPVATAGEDSKSQACRPPPSTCPRK
jgi:outer membrane protein OmpA-like peptidoglycan-associated protein